eukprot:Hpha_TRINITY_DN15616_c6_g1::TRINITY_DN15616_c6_g1_i1::g.101767::m.101767/K11968/ARIH1; ariadne-1
MSDCESWEVDDDCVDEDEDEDERMQGASPFSDRGRGDDFMAIDSNPGESATEPGALVKRSEQRVWSTAALLEAQKACVDSVVDLLKISPATARILLRHYGWDKNRLVECFFEDGDRLLRKLGISAETGPPFITRRAGGGTRCGICCSEEESDVCVALPQCMHWFCTSCFATYLAHAITEQGMACLGLTCPGAGCETACHLEVLEGLLGTATLEPPYAGRNQELLARYLGYEARSFVEHNSQFRWCPSAGCGRAVSLVDCRVGPGTPHVVGCDCGQEFCFLCGHENHSPATCKQFRSWLCKEKDESETASWLVAHTKPCPKCFEPIEKSGGCNHMQCLKCKYDWCWVCEKEWAKHGTSWYQCNFFDSESADLQNGERDPRFELKHYAHMYARYRNHDLSKQFELELLRRVQGNMRHLQEQNAEKLHQVEHLEEAALELCKARQTLKYTYVYVYYLRDSPERRLFEFNQSSLEHATETLSGYLERNATDRQTVVNLQGVVRQSMRRLQTGVLSSVHEANSDDLTIMKK